MAKSQFVTAGILVLTLAVQVHANTKSDPTWGEANVRYSCCCCCDGRLVRFYTVDGREVRETEWCIIEKGMPITVREFRISPSKRSIVMTLASSDQFVQLTSNAKRTVVRNGDNKRANGFWFTWHGEAFLGFDNWNRAHIGGSGRTLRFRVLIWSGRADDWNKFVALAERK